VQAGCSGTNIIAAIIFSIATKKINIVASKKICISKKIVVFKHTTCRI